MPTLALPDGRIAQYWLGGADDGPVALFFHGCPDTRWAARTGEEAARAAGVRILCVNRPGYGLSTVTPSTHVGAAGDALAVADLLGIAEVAAIGMSVGGGYAAACAAAFPERVTALEILATMPPPDTEPAESVEEAMARYAPGFAEYVGGLVLEDPDDQALVDRFLEGLPPPDAALLLASSSVPDIATSVREALVDHRGYLRDAALTFRPWSFDLAAIRCPVVLRYGSADERAMPGGPWLAERVPQARLDVVPDATHLATLLGSWPEVLGSVLG